MRALPRRPSASTRRRVRERASRSPPLPDGAASCRLGRANAELFVGDAEQLDRRAAVVRDLDERLRREELDDGSDGPCRQAAAGVPQLDDVQEFHLSLHRLSHYASRGGSTTYAVTNLGAPRGATSHTVRTDRVSPFSPSTGTTAPYRRPHGVSRTDVAGAWR